MLARALLALSLIVSIAVPALAADSGPIVRYSAKGKYGNVRDDVMNAITGRGLVIDNTSHVAVMLDRTGKDLGATKKVYGEDQGQVFSFCSAVVSRRTMEADPHNIAFCPYAIAVYSTASEPDTVYVAYRRPQSPGADAASTAALREVESLLDGIVREALSLPPK
jgi:uncharacterized protein (DUF302 family)